MDRSVIPTSSHALITGGGTGIGAAIATALAEIGTNLTLLGRSSDRLEKHCENLKESFKGDYGFITADLEKLDNLASIVQTAVSARGPINILINNAAYAESAPLERTELQLWQKMMDLNVTAPFLLIKHTLPHMKNLGFGRIVNMGSTASLQGFQYVSAYCATKHALLGLTRSLALELKDNKVTANIICPGYVDTDLLQRSVDNIVAKTGASIDQARSKLAACNSSGRLITPEEVARKVAWLCQPAQSAVNGEIFSIE